MIITNARIMSMTGNDYDNGYIKFEDDIISEVGRMSEFHLELYKEEEIIDVASATVVPGIIDAHCHIGISEEDIGNEGDDMNEIGMPIVPQLRVIDAINPQDIAFKEAIEAGITTVAVCPGSANIMGGQCAVIKTYGTCIDKMIIDKNVAIKVALGENPKKVYGNRGMTPMTRMGIAWLLREKLREAQIYANEKELCDGEKIDYGNEALIPVLKKEIPLKIHVHRADDIMTAIRIAKEFDIRITLEHCTQCGKVADEIVEANYPVMMGPLILFRDKDELKGQNVEDYVEMYRRGITCAIISDHPVVPIKHFLTSAAQLLKYGLSESDILKMLTINPARILGIEKQYGSIEKGKKANVAIFRREIFNTLPEVIYTIIDGKIVYKGGK